MNIRIFVGYLLLSTTLQAFAARTLILSTDQEKNFGIEVETPVLVDHTFGDKLPAKVTIPNSQLNIVSAQQGGLIEKLYAAVGEEVMQGQKLARIQSPDLVALQSDFLLKHTQLKLAKTIAERDQQLFKEGIIAERRLLESQSEYQELLTSLTQSQQALSLAGMDNNAISQLQKHHRLSSTLMIYAPLDGEVQEQMASAGQRIEPATPLYRIAQLQPLWLEIHAPLEQAEQARVGDKIKVLDYGVEGIITTIGRDVHIADQGVLIRAEVNQGADRLRPGQFLQVQLANSTSNQVHYRISRSALVRHEQQPAIFIKTGHEFRLTPIKLIAEQPELIINHIQLTPESHIVTRGTAALKAALSISEDH